MKIALGTFACFCIETRFGPNIAAGVREALQSYLASLDSAIAPLAFPDFCRRLPTGGVELELSVPSEVEEALELEARKQEVQVEQLLTHAVFVYVATEEDSRSLRCRPDDEPLL